MKNLFFIVIFIFLFVPFVVAQSDADTVKTYKPVVFPAGYTSQLDVVYTKVNGWDGRMDIYLPPNAGKSTPVIINIHGGGWNHGVKEAQGGFNTYFKAGFAVANVEYRLTSQATAPAAIQDIRCALIYLIKKAKEFNIDNNKIIIMGGSAGGHLALMAGLLGNDNRFDNNCPGEKNIKVAAIIDKWGITDVWDWAYGPNIKSKSPIRWLGDKVLDSVFAASVSPMSYVTKNSPPIFIIHGNADPTVPYQHSIDLHNKLVALGVKTEFVTVEGGLHGKFTKEKVAELNKSILEFIFSLNEFK
jgi:acetyl esterase/lipase